MKNFKVAFQHRPQQPYEWSYHNNNNIAKKSIQKSGILVWINTIRHCTKPAHQHCPTMPPTTRDHATCHSHCHRLLRLDLDTFWAPKTYKWSKRIMRRSPPLPSIRPNKLFNNSTNSSTPACHHRAEWIRRLRLVQKRKSSTRQVVRFSRRSLWGKRRNCFDWVWMRRGHFSTKRGQWRTGCMLYLACMMMRRQSWRWYDHSIECLSHGLKALVYRRSWEGKLAWQLQIKSSSMPIRGGHRNSYSLHLYRLFE